MPPVTGDIAARLADHLMSEAQRVALKAACFRAVLVLSHRHTQQSCTCGNPDGGRGSQG